MPEPLPLKLSNVVIVEGPALSAADLAAHFRTFGIAVHVVATAAAAEALIRNKRVDVVVLAFSLTDDVRQLKHLLCRRGVPYISCATARSMDLLSSQA